MTRKQKRYKPPVGLPQAHKQQGKIITLPAEHPPGKQPAPPPPAIAGKSTPPPQRRAPVQTEYVLKQYYTITIDEQLIDQEMAHHHAADPTWIEEETARFKRMLGALLANEQALSACCVYVMLRYQDSEYESSYIPERYGAAISFAHILAAHADIFAAEDRQWLLTLLHQYTHTAAGSQDEASGEDEDLFDLDLQVEGLEAAFQIEPSGFLTAPVKNTSP